MWIKCGEMDHRTCFGGNVRAHDLFRQLSGDLLKLKMPVPPKSAREDFHSLGLRDESKVKNNTHSPVP